MTRNSHRVECVALSADGLTLAVGGYGNVGELSSLFRLDAAAKTVTPLATGVGVRLERCACSALTADGGRLAVGAKMSGNLAVFDAATGRLIARHPSAHASPIVAIAFSGDGARLATADAEGTIKIWADLQKLDSKSAALLTLKGHQGAINTVGFSSDGKRLVTASADKTARVWDLENAGAAIRPLEGLADDGSLVARFSPDGQLIAAANGRSLRLWDAATGRLVRELSPGEKGRVSSVAFSPTDNRLLAVGYGGQADVSYVALWDIDAGTELARLTGATDLPDFPAGEDDRAGRCAGVFARRQESGRWIRLKARALGPCFSQSAEGLGSRHAPTGPPAEWTHELLCFSRLLAGRIAVGQRQPRRDGDHLVDPDVESDAHAPESREELASGRTEHGRGCGLFAGRQDPGPGEL